MAQERVRGPVAAPVGILGQETPKGMLEKRAGLFGAAAEGKKTHTRLGEMVPAIGTQTGPGGSSRRAVLTLGNSEIIPDWGGEILDLHLEKTVAMGGGITHKVEQGGGGLPTSSTDPPSATQKRDHPKIPQSSAPSSSSPVGCRHCLSASGFKKGKGAEEKYGGEEQRARLSPVCVWGGGHTHRVQLYVGGGLPSPTHLSQAPSLPAIQSSSVSAPRTEASDRSAIGGGFVRQKPLFQDIHSLCKDHSAKEHPQVKGLPYPI